jgi:hypothetical protein
MKFQAFNNLKILQIYSVYLIAYRHWPARVKSKLDQPGKPWPEILPVNLTVSEI